MNSDTACTDCKNQFIYVGTCRGCNIDLCNTCITDKKPFCKECNAQEKFTCVECKRKDLEMDTCATCDNFMHGPEGRSPGGDGCGHHCHHCDAGFNHCSECHAKWKHDNHCNRCKNIKDCKECQDINCEWCGRQKPDVSFLGECKKECGLCDECCNCAVNQQPAPEPTIAFKPAALLPPDHSTCTDYIGADPCEGPITPCPMCKKPMCENHLTEADDHDDDTDWICWLCKMNCDEVDRCGCDCHSCESCDGENRSECGDHKCTCACENNGDDDNDEP